MKVRGRFWLGLWLLLFLAVAVVIVARQRSALGIAAELNALRGKRLALEAERAEYERRIREASSRKVLVPRAEAKLDLHMPSDSQVVNFQLPPVRGDSGT
jgi:cell division protein FtsL